MGVLVAAVLLGVHLRRVAHEALSSTGVRLREQREMGSLGMIAEIVAFGRQLVEVSGRPVLFGGFQVRSNGGMASHDIINPYFTRIAAS